MLKLQLPSRAVAPVEPPTTAALLASDGSLVGICAAVLAHRDVAAEALDDVDLYALAEWALSTYAGSVEATALALTCHVFAERPSARLGVADAQLAYQLDVELASALMGREKAPARPDDKRERLVVHDMSATLEEGRHDDDA